MKVFISHQSNDVAIAKALVDLLRLSLNLQPEDIRCTSVDGYRLAAGADTEAELRREVHEADVFIGLITPHSMDSAYVLFELGARWGAEKPLFPLMASGMTSNRLRGPLTGLNALDCSERGQVNQLIEDLAVELSVDTVRPSSYQGMINELVSASGAPEKPSIIAEEAIPMPEAIPMLEAIQNSTAVTDKILVILAGEAVGADGEVDNATLIQETGLNRVRVEVAVDDMLIEGLIGHLTNYVELVGLTLKGKRYLIDHGLV